MSKSKKKVQDYPTHVKNSEITVLDVINLISLKNIHVKDLNYVKNHISIHKSNTKTIYEIIIKDIDGEMYALKMELKTYS